MTGSPDGERDRRGGRSASAPRAEARTTLHDRCGGAAVGLVAGLVVGLAAFLLAAGTVDPLLVPGLAALFGLAGLAWPWRLISVAEGLLHLFLGAALVRKGIEPDATAPPWLKLLFWLGCAAGLGLWLLLRHR